jgi:predicted nuclease of predicted toxin-antitoxin system
MRVLLDNCVDHRFGLLLQNHEVVHARDVGWQLLKNGDLIAKAEASDFPVLITVDKNLRYQQNITGRKINIIILNSKRVTYRHIEPLAEQVLQALQNLGKGSYIIIEPEN